MRTDRSSNVHVPPQALAGHRMEPNWVKVQTQHPSAPASATEESTIEDYPTLPPYDELLHTLNKEMAYAYTASLV